MRNPRCVILLILLAAISVAAQTPASQIPVPSDVASPPANATKTKNGVASEVIKPGTGEARPIKDDVVTIQYSAWTTDGKMFDSSVVRGRPSEMALKNMLPGLAEGIEQMQVGETRRLWIPEKLGFKGKEGKPKGTLVFDVTLVDIPTHAPADVKALRRCHEDRQWPGLPGVAAGYWDASSNISGHGERALHRMDHGRQNVR